jgi:hypothetical protein
MSKRYKHIVVDTEGNGRNWLREAGFVEVVRSATPEEVMSRYGHRADLSRYVQKMMVGRTLHIQPFYDTRDPRGGGVMARESVDALFKWLNPGEWDRVVFWADNPAFDWSPLNSLLHDYLGGNPFGWSARRIGDFYAGLVGDPHKASEWKAYRVTKHDHNPVNDALGNAEALCHMLNERGMLL